MEKETKTGQMSFQDFYPPQNEKNKALKHELEASNHEMQNLKRLVEKLETKLNEALAAKKKLSHDVSALRAKEDSYKRVTSF